MQDLIIFAVSQEEDGSFIAECLSEDIFTQGDNWEDLKINVQEAVKAFYFDYLTPNAIPLHLVKNYRNRRMSLCVKYQLMNYGKLL